jgi:hypothetical protein
LIEREDRLREEKEMEEIRKREEGLKEKDTNR